MINSHNVTNIEFTKDGIFLKAVKLGNEIFGTEDRPVLPTKRQASRFRMGKGAAWKALKQSVLLKGGK